MSPRPRRVTDDDVLDAAEVVRDACGPLGFTLDEVGARVGVSAPALLRRFGSKRALLLAVKEREVRRVVERVAGAPPTSQRTSPLAALLARFRDGVAVTAPTPDALANAFAFLHTDLADAESRALIQARAAALRAGLRALVAAAVDAGELGGAPPNDIADLVEATYNGALVGWVVERDGAAWDYVRPRLEALLAPYRRDS